MIESSIYKIKSGKVNIWKNWCKKLSTEYKNEALETLKEEHILEEVFVMFEIDGIFYTIGQVFSKGETKSFPSDKSRSINKEHREKMDECLEKLPDSSVSLLYRLAV
jgi:hypothetical protein